MTGIAVIAVIADIAVLGKAKPEAYRRREEACVRFSV